jgi:putative copper export protein
MWAGGLIMLGIVVGVARRKVPEHARVAFLRAVARRFAVLGGVSLAVLIVTGIDMASDRHVWGDLTDTTYGRTLLAKLILVALVVFLTVLHSAVQGPALSRLRAEAVERPDDDELRRRIRAKAARSGVVSLLTVVATLAILVLAARLVTG